MAGEAADRQEKGRGRQMTSFDETPEHGWRIDRLLEESARARPDFPFLHFDGRDFSHAEMNNRANRMAAGLIALGLQPGTRVAVMMNSAPEYIDVWFAIAKAGAVEVPLNTAYKGEILSHMLNNTGAVMMVLDAEFLPAVAAIAARCPALERFIVRHEDGVVNDVELPGARHDLADILLGAGDNLDLEIAPETLACIMFTSGTTGPSKGVMLTHKFEISFAAVYIDIVSLTAADVSYNMLPFFHIAGKFILISALLTGGRMILRERFSASHFWPDVRRHRVTVTVAVGGICHMLYAAPRQADDADNPLRMIYAVPRPHDVEDDFKSRFSLELTEGYGSTEANICVYTRPGETTPKGSCGRSAPEYEVKIVDAAGRECAPGEAGEFAVRPKYANTLMSGYYGMAEKTLEAFRHLWFHSGDKGMRDEAGYFYFLDRMKDAIRRRGENISSFEVERILNMHDHVAESAVVAVPAEAGEDDVKAVVVLNPGAQLSAAALLDYCVDAMPYFMVPRYFEFKPGLPRTPTQKIRKIELRSEGVTPATWDREQAGFRVTRHGLEKIA